MLEMEQKTDELGQALKNEDLSIDDSDKDNDEEIMSSKENDLLLTLPSPNSRSRFHNKPSLLWGLIAENANNTNAQVG